MKSQNDAVNSAVVDAVDQAVFQSQNDPEHPALQDFLSPDLRLAEIGA